MNAQTKPYAIGRALVFLALFSILTGCSWLRPAPIVKTETRYILPPEYLLDDCPRPQLVGEYNRDLWAAYQARGAALDECNADKRALRAWRLDHGRGG